MIFALAVSVFGVMVAFIALTVIWVGASLLGGVTLTFEGAHVGGVVDVEVSDGADEDSPRNILENLSLSSTHGSLSIN